MRPELPPRPCPGRLGRLVAHLHRQALNSKFGGDSPTVHAVVEAYPPVRKCHRTERVGVADAVPGGDNARCQLLAR